MGKLKDYFLTPFVSIVIAIILNKLHLISFENSKELIKQFPVIGTCSFGFLLTMFTVLIQGTNPALKKMRDRKKPFLRFVSFNKYAVVLSFAVTLYSFFIGNYYFGNHPILLKYLCLIFYVLFLWFIGQTFYFLIVFYILTKSLNNK